VFCGSNLGDQIKHVLYKHLKQSLQWSITPTLTYLGVAVYPEDFILVLKVRGCLSVNEGLRPTLASSENVFTKIVYLNNCTGIIQSKQGPTTHLQDLLHLLISTRNKGSQDCSHSKFGQVYLNTFCSLWESWTLRIYMTFTQNLRHRITKRSHKQNRYLFSLLYGHLLKRPYPIKAY